MVIERAGTASVRVHMSGVAAVAGGTLGGAREGGNAPAERIGEVWPALGDLGRDARRRLWQMVSALAVIVTVSPEARERLAPLLATLWRFLGGAP